MVSYPAPKTTPHAQHNDTLNTLFWNYRRCQHRSFHRSACSSPSHLPDSPGSLDTPPARLRPHRPIRPAPGRLDVLPGRAGPPPLGSALHRSFFDHRPAAPGRLCPSKHRHCQPASHRLPRRRRLPSHHEGVFLLEFE
jgi:hypothetical protein